MGHRFTVISPVYNVGHYLPDFFRSLEEQDGGLADVEIILVNDGSTDDSLRQCEVFARQNPENVRVISKPNGGQASARNAAIPHATAPWVTFPDSDDALSPNYFSAVREYMEDPQNHDVEIFASHIVKWFDVEDVVHDNHPTAFRFRSGNVTVDLENEPRYIHGNACLTFFRRETVQREQLEFRSELRTRFEDGHFISQYLLHCESARLGLVDDAQYFYRQRSDGSSTVQRARIDTRTYEFVPKHGYMSALRQAQQLKGSIPRWLQTLVLYDFLWLFKSDVHSKVPSRSLPHDILAKFHEQIGEVVKLLEREVVLAFDMMPVPAWLLEGTAFGYTDAPYRGPAYLGEYDTGRRLVELRYRFTGDLPREVIFVGVQNVEPRYTKVKTLDVLGKTLLKERRIWVSSEDVIRLELDGQIMKIETQEITPGSFKLTVSEVKRAKEEARQNAVPALYRRNDMRLREQVARSAKSTGKWIKAKARKEGLFDLLLSTSMRMVWNRRRFGASWAIMDREYEANDSAEQLYRWIDANRPDIKKWFVIRKSSKEWQRLKRDGFRLVNYGSFNWKLLLLLCSNLVSSHADMYVTNPIPVGRFGKPQWRLTFLQHGVIKGDLSTWLNRKDINIMVTSTEDEYRYIVGESPYSLGSAQVRLTGLPRYDALLEKSRTVAPEDVRQIVIAPTWRQYLAGHFTQGSIRKQIEGFAESDYVQYWQSFLNSPELHEAAAASNLEIVFMPHPNVQPYLDQFKVPDIVRVQRYADADIQQVISRTSLLVTDYSSIAFNLAYLYRPVVYFQFDQDRYRSEHTEGDAYYSYETDGFGPVTQTQDETIHAIRKLLTDTAYAEEYIERAKRTFPVRDGRNSERVFRAIEELDQPLDFNTATTRAKPESWE